MNNQQIIKALGDNMPVFESLLIGLSPEEYRWKPAEEKWCLLEIICHLYDEEREDFRKRTRHVLENPQSPMDPIAPVQWVQERAYIQQDYDDRLCMFLEERKHSLNWLSELRNPPWDNQYQHPKLGPMTARQFLLNWLAHDFLHLRQIIRTKYQYMQSKSDTDVSYAGNW